MIVPSPWANHFSPHRNAAPTGLGHEPQREGAALSGSARIETMAGPPASRFVGTFLHPLELAVSRSWVRWMKLNEPTAIAGGMGPILYGWWSIINHYEARVASSKPVMIIEPSIDSKLCVVLFALELVSLSIRDLRVIVPTSWLTIRLL